MTPQELAAGIVAELIRKSGVREFQNEEFAIQTAQTAALMALRICLDTELDDMALPDVFVNLEGTALTIRNSGGNAAITLASLPNGNGTTTGARQSVTLDFGATWAEAWRLETEFEMAATPTAGNAINLYASWSGSTGAGEGNTSGTDSSYTGYSSNIDAAVRHLEFLGAHICTSQTTTTVQRAVIGIIRPKGRYMNLVVDNRSGAAFHSTDTNQLIRFTALTSRVDD